MGIFSGIVKTALSPVKGISEVFEDLSGENGEDSKITSILTTGLSSVAKGTAKGIKDGVDDIFDK